jgi:hypothetical protein
MYDRWVIGALTKRNAKGKMTQGEMNAIFQPYLRCCRLR